MKKTIKSLIETTGYTIAKIPKRGPQTQKPVTKNHLLELYFSMIDPNKFFFVQIGAHDGIHGDPLHDYIVKYNLHGVCIEPQPDVFKLLQANYANNPNVECVNAAIGTIDGTIPFYGVLDNLKTSDNFDAMTRLASFDRDFVRNALMRRIPFGIDPEGYIKEIQVPVKTFDSLMKERERVDFLQIDAEGYDWEILKTVDLTKYRPKIINLESIHFTDETHQKCEEYLAVSGYKYFRDRSDTCAFRIY